jgi:hypothetical protein
MGMERNLVVAVARPCDPKRRRPMLADYRQWLDAELKRLGGAGHDAFSMGQANMAKRAIEHLDRLAEGRLTLALERGRVDAILTALEQLSERNTSLDPTLEALRVSLQTARSEGI